MKFMYNEILLIKYMVMVLNFILVTMVAITTTIYQSYLIYYYILWLATYIELILIPKSIYK